MSRSRKVYLVNPDIIDRFSKGQKCQRIADVYGVTADTIRRAIKSVGIAVVRERPRREWTRAEETLLIRLLAEGRTYDEAASLMGRTRRSIDGKIYQLRKVKNPELYMRRRSVNYDDRVLRMAEAG